MSSLTYTIPKGYSTKLSDEYGYSQAVRLPTNPPTLKVSGQGGWDETTGIIAEPTSADAVAQQIDQAFANVDNVLRSAGSKNGWADVYLVRSYMVGLENFEGEVFKAQVRNLEKWCPQHKPVWTTVEVKALGLEAMRIEVEVEASVE